MPVTASIENNTFTDLRITEETFDIYDVEFNGVVLNHTPYGSYVEFDRDSDVRVYVSISEDEILNNIDENTLISYLNSKGYGVYKSE